MEEVGVLAREGEGEGEGGGRQGRAGELDRSALVECQALKVRCRWRRAWRTRPKVVHVFLQSPLTLKLVKKLKSY